jgi:xanthine dehydrogenase YagS FAD-binding subunit
VRVPARAAGTRSIYLKATDRAVWAFATVSVAAVARSTHGLIDELSIVLGGVAAVPWRIDAQALKGARPDDAAIAAVAREALAAADPLRMNAYKVPMAEALVRRALHALTD